MSVVSKSAETNAVSAYYVSRLAGPRLGKLRVTRGDRVDLSEHQARALLLSGELVTDKGRVDDPFGEAAAAKATKDGVDKAAAEAKTAEAKTADAKAVEDKAAEDKVAHDARQAEEAAAAQAATEKLAVEKLAADTAAGHHDETTHDDHAAG